LTTAYTVSRHPRHSHREKTNRNPDRLFQHYWPLAHKLLSKPLYLLAKPRETPLADNFVLDTCATTDTAPFTLLNRLQSTTFSQLDDIDIAAECLDHMVAGIDTTGDALCFLMWELSQPRSMGFQRRLQQELVTTTTTTTGSDSKNPGAGLMDAKQFPFLDAVVMEGLRCFPAIPMSLPRCVPAGGRSIDGYFLPAGTTVCCQAYSVQKLDTGVFPDPERFDPDRWLDSKGDVERKRLFFAFANGGRGCVGKQ